LLVTILNHYFERCAALSDTYYSASRALLLIRVLPTFDHAHNPMHPLLEITRQRLSPVDVREIPHQRCTNVCARGR